MRVVSCCRLTQTGAWRAAAVAFLGLCLGAPLAAADDAKPRDPAAVITQLFQNPDAAQSLLAPSIDQTAAEKLATVARQVSRALGPVDGVDYVDWKYRIRFAKALAFVDAEFDPQARLTSFRILREAPRIQSLEQAEKLVLGLSDKTALLIEKGGKDLAAAEADTPLAVGSAFKLSYLAALADAVKAGRLAWAQLVPLQAKWRALPTGILQDWPAESPMTIEALASLMISLSDNTATDAVMDLVGRDAIQKYAYGNDPILSPREYLVLSSQGEAPLQQRFLAASPADRAGMLKSIATAPLPQTGEIGVVAPSPIEWHYSARQLCTLIEQVHALPAMQINTGLAARSDWSEIAFKGGGDHGVFNITTRLAPKEGPAYCVSVTVNGDHDLNETQLVSVLTGLVFYLHDKSP
ncbi:MAG TPA: serine hydrolase [Stellaceae bacterium]|nr:serine hydrolase [Stellaceae bacterium]